MLTKSRSGRLSALLVASLLLGGGSALAGQPQNFRGTAVEWKALNPELDTLAQVVARAMRDPALRQLVYQEAALRRTGDTEALMRELDRTSHGRFRRALVQAYQDVQAAAGHRVGSLEADTTLGSLMSRVPNLHVAVRGQLSQWDAATQQLLVAFAPTGADERALASIRAYDAAGASHALDAHTAPRAPVLVVGVNERTVVSDSGEVTVDPGLVCDTCDGSGGGGGGGGTTSSCSTSTSRWDGTNELLTNLSVWNDQEYWWAGDAEVRLQVAKPQNSDYATLYSGYFTADWDGTTTRFYDRILFNWYNTDPDAFLFYKWVEEDGGPSIGVDVSGTYYGITAKASFKIYNDDDDMGYLVVGWRDPARGYDTGYVSWGECWR